MSAATLADPVPATPGAIDAQQLLRRVSALPALPKAAMEVVAILRDDDATIDDCAQRIAHDPSLTARTLRLANSAFYGVPGRVATVRDAILLLGRRTVSALLTTAAVSSQFDPRQCPGFDFGQFWKHALGTAIAAQSVARKRDADLELAFIAGLLHDVGRLALATHFPAEQAAAVAHMRAHDLPVIEAERAVLGIDHAQVGSRIAAHWHFPATVVEAIAWHHEPSAEPGRRSRASLSDMVYLGDSVAHALDLAGDENEAVPLFDPRAWERLALEPAQCLRVLERTETGVAALCQALTL